MSFPVTPDRPDLVRASPRQIPPRADIPGRPDAPARRDGSRRAPPRWLLPVAIVAVLALFAVAGLAFDSGSRDVAHRPGSALSSPGEAYAFLDERTYVGRRVPVRWNPCEPIEFQVNVEGAPSDALDEIQRATSRVTDATGITFAFDGTTGRTLRQTGRDYFFSDGVAGTYYPVLFIWIPHEKMVRLTKEGDVLAFTHPELGEAERSDQWVSGWIVIDAGGRFEPSGRYSLELVLMHEIGHLLGLDHVTEPDELMFSTEVAPDTRPDQMYDWGQGDLAGLELLGRDQGCMDPVDVAP